MSRGISHLTYLTAYTPFTPSDSEQRLLPPCYRGCWHGVSRSLFVSYRQATRYSPDRISSLTKEVYNPRAFILHAASLGQGFPHCRSLSTAASRRSLGRVSVPVWLTILSDQLPIVALVVFYTAN